MKRPPTSAFTWVFVFGALRPHCSRRAPAYPRANFPGPRRVEKRGDFRFAGGFPTGKVLEGVYVDDHLVVGICGRDDVAEPEACEDWGRVLRARRAHEQAGLPVAADKRVDLAERFTAWGTEVDGSSGQVWGSGGPTSSTCVFVGSGLVSESLLEGVA
jgi:hypothetical protein